MVLKWSLVYLVSIFLSILVVKADLIMWSSFSGARKALLLPRAV